MNKRVTMNLILAGGIGLPVAGLAGPFGAYWMELLHKALLLVVCVDLYSTCQVVSVTLLLSAPPRAQC